MNGGSILFFLGRPFAPLYSALMRWREYLYHRNIMRVTRLPVPVVSVGNLTMGGTGKTPVVRYIASLLQRAGMRPAVISRGYGGSTRERVNLVASREAVLLEAAFAGDEPRFLAETLPGVEILTGVVRRLPAAEAVKRGADVLVLDDGFQHLALARDLDLVLFRAETLAGNSRVFPGGDLREPVAALHRCHAFLLTDVREHNRQRAERFAGLLGERFPGKPVFFSTYAPAGFVQADAKGRLQLTDGPRAGTTGLAFCGIARPEGFRQTMEDLQVRVAGFFSLSDHHRYGEKDMEFLVRRAAAVKADYLITTEKDLVKFLGSSVPLPMYAIRMEVSLPPAFDDLVLDRVRARSTLLPSFPLD